VTELSRYVFSPLREGDFTLYRGSCNGIAPILLVAAEDASLWSSKRLEHEYALKGELDVAWAAKPVALSRYNDRLALVLEDPGGERLDQLLGRPLEVSEFLHIAIPLASALRCLHERGLIHKDIKPANVLVDIVSGGVWLTGFGIASRLPRERQNPEPPEVIAGTLAYMAPEQTGRMNRSIDSRSDLYSLGITFYEMLTGTLPFRAADPMEWVHCHIARQVDPPDERAKEIPKVLSSIVMKLLAKTAEERYQTAAGVEADMRRCLAEWESHRRIDPFPLGTQDASERLRIPEKLYGRDREIDTLLAAFDRVVAQGTAELVLVSGYSGIGKSSVVNELHKVLVPPRGLFASGKFDQYKRDIPYATLAQAFQSLIHLLLRKSEAELGLWRETLREALGPNGTLITNLIPELELIIGKQPSVADLSPHETQKRFQTVVRKFVSVFARPEHPLALFLDDLQWLDAATIDVLAHLVTHPEVRHLLLVGAYRDNEVHPSGPLMRTLEEIRKSKAKVCDVVLAPLTLHDVEHLIVDSFHCVLEHARSLSQLVQEKTAGNPFFVIQFILALVEDRLIAFDRSSAAWNWDLARVQARGFTDNVVDLMVGKLGRLPDRTQDVLKLFACLGNTAEIATLAIVLGEPEAAIDSHLQEAVRVGLVLRLDRNYTFLHDRVQEAAYSLIPVDQRATLHLRIGRCLVAGMSKEKLTEQIFDVVSQLSHGAALISDPDERGLAADLNLRAGRKAKASTAYASAVNYFSAGMALLGPSGWATRYDLAFGLMLERAECSLLSSQFDETERLITELLRRAASTVDRAAVYRLKIELHVVRSENPQAVESALECLRLFDIDMPAHPSRDEVHAEYEKIWRNLGDCPIDRLIDMPRTTSAEAHAAMRVLAALIPPAFYTDANLFDLQVCQMVNLTLKRGMTDVSSHGFGWFGWILCYAFCRYDDGYRFGRLALDLVEKRGFLDPAKVHYAMGLIVTWTKPLATSIDFFRTAFRIGVETGDLFFAVSSASQIIIRLILTGLPLEEAWRESQKFMDFAGKIGFRDGVDLIVPQQRFVAAMRGETASLSTFSDEEFNESAFEAEFTADRMPTMVCWYWILKIEARFLSGDYGQALEAVEKATQLMWATPGEIQLLDYHLYSALTLASHVAAIPPEQHGEWRRRIREHWEPLREWAQNNPGNFASASALVEAEIARIEDRALEAMDLYEGAIRTAREQGFIQTEGVGNELAARFYAARGFEMIAHTYLRNARHCYLRWGADGKVRQLEQLHPHLREKPIPASTITFGAPVEQLDIATVVKASQAVSSEIELSKLVEMLMTIALEHAGAERGLLILFRGDKPQIEAEATTDHGRVEVTLREVAVTPSDMPESILHYVIRTRESVVLDDALVSNLYSEDEYVRQKRPRSVLCLPFVKQAKLVGALYLENTLTPHAFPSSRVTVLELLASQAAISLENAALYSDLRHSEAYLAEAQRLSQTGSFGWNVSSGEIFWSEETFRIFGYDPAVSATLDMVLRRVHSQDLALVRRTIERVTGSGKDVDYEHRLLMPDGSVKHIRVVARAARDKSGSTELVGAVMDVTAVKETEAALKERASLLNLTHDSILIRNMDGVISYWNHGAEELYGWTVEEAVGKTSHQLLQTVFPVPLAELNAELQRAGLWEGELVQTKADGTRVVVASRWSLQCDRRQRPLAILETNDDITERKRAEEGLRQAEAELAHATRLTTLGELTASIAHEVNQPLTGVVSSGNACLNWLDSQPPNIEKARRSVDRIIKQGNRAAEVIQRIRAFSQKTAVHKAPLDINDLIEDVMPLVRHEVLVHEVSLRLELAAALPPVLGDRVQLQQVIVNLLMNGIQAMRSVTDRSRELLIRSREHVPDQILVAVKDSGIGIEPANVDRLFDAFFTTKPDGMGMGLSICRSIVNQHNGLIWATRNSGAGSTFQFTLHACRETA
jgi:PAS domain S-box-containing protein